MSFRKVAGRLVESDALGPARAEIAATLGFMTEPVPVQSDLRKLSEHAKQHFDTTGEILPDYAFTEARQSFKIDFSTKGGTDPE